MKKNILLIMMDLINQPMKLIIVNIYHKDLIIKWRIKIK